MTKCPCCGVGFQKHDDFDDLAGHFVAMAGRSDAGHVMWLNRNITKEKSDRKTLSGLLSGFFDLVLDHGFVGLEMFVTVFVATPDPARHRCLRVSLSGP